MKSACLPAGIIRIIYMINTILKTIIWLGLGLILFSPLYVDSDFFFPYIVPKTVLFNISVEIIFLAFLLLVWQSKDAVAKKYSLNLNLSVVLFSVYLAIVTLASLLGDNFFRSFWSNFERNEGILLLIHLFLFLIVLSGFLKKLKSWLKVLDIFFFSSILVSLVALGQFLEVHWISSVGSGRLAGTLGNAGYMAGYLIFGIFFGLILVFQRKQKFLKFYYGIFIILETFIIFNTLTRGGLLAFFAASFLFLMYLCFFYFKNNKAKALGWFLIAVVILGPPILYAFKDSSMVQDTKILNRLSSISLNAKTAQTRMMAWESAWKGFLERPILGWGYENFYQPFDKYFNPKIYEDSGSVVWFDRAHNIIFDRIVTGGILGLLAYLSFLLLPIIYLWRYWLKKSAYDIDSQEKDKPESSGGVNNEALNVPRARQYFIPVTLTLVILAYFIQNLFIFETLVIYIPLFLTIAFIGSYTPSLNWSFLENKKFQGGLFLVASIVVVLSFYTVHIKPVQANLKLTKALNSKNLTMNQRIDLFEEVLENKTLGKQESRRQIFELFETLMARNYDDQQTLGRMVKLLKEETDKQIQENPHKVSYYLVKMRFNNTMFRKFKIKEYIEENFQLMQKAKRLSPTRQQVYFEIGYTYLYLGNYFELEGKPEKAKEHHQKAIGNFRTALELNDKNFESYKQLINALIFADKNEEVFDLLEKMEQKDIAYKKESFYPQVINTAISGRNYQIIKYIAQELINLNSDNPQYYIQLALAYAYLGEDREAIETAKRILEIENMEEDQKKAYQQQVAAFINKVQSGGY